MKDEKITIRLERKLLDELEKEYYENDWWIENSFSEFIRTKLKKGEQK